jgi:hypothetical protein
MKLRCSLQPLRIASVFLAMAAGLVHGFGPALAGDKARGAPAKSEATAPMPDAEPAGKQEILRDPSALPPAVQRMRAAILTAAMSGDVEALRVPIEMNEIPPIFAKETGGDPISHLKSSSGDGEGREIMAILVEILRTGCIRKKAQTGEEMFVWPYFAEVSLKELTPGQQVELFTLVPVARAKDMIASGQYDHFRLGIAADGTWHFFSKAP